MQVASGQRVVADRTLFQSTDSAAWQAVYDQTLEPKYHKNKRNFNTQIQVTPRQGQIYVVPRVRGGSSYKDVTFSDGLTAAEVHFCPISKGYPMQEVSSFSLGPVVGSGLCVVNAAFSKIITIQHLEGGACDLKRKTFWRPQPQRKIVLLNADEMLVNQIKVNIKEWLNANTKLWYDEWSKWSEAIALCSRGDFHWSNSSPIVSYYVQGEYVDFVQWKIQTYIRPAIDLIRRTKVYKHLYTWHNQKIALALVHPKSKEDVIEPLSLEFIEQLYTDPQRMCCMPYVVAGCLLGVSI